MFALLVSLSVCQGNIPIKESKKVQDKKLINTKIINKRIILLPAHY